MPKTAIHTSTTPKTPTSPAALTEQDAAIFVQMSPSYLRKGRRLGYGPDFLRLGRRVRYAISDLQAWLDGNRVTHRGA